MTCQSANQLQRFPARFPANTCKGFLSLQNGLSVWFTRLHNHGEDCWSDSCPEDNHWHPSQGGEATNIHYQRSCSQSAVSEHVNRKLSGRKRCTTNRENRSLMRIVKQNWFKNLGELHKEWTEAGVKASRAPHTDVSRNLATVVASGVLPGLRRRRTGLLPSGPKFSFQMRASFLFHLETKVLESRGRVEKLIAPSDEMLNQCPGSLWSLKIPGCPSKRVGV